MAERAVLTPRYITVVKETTERGELVNPSGFVFEWMMTKEATKEMMLEALLDQADVARQRGCKQSPGTLKTTNLQARTGSTGTCYH